MLDDMHKVINRISEIQKRFAPRRNYSLQSAGIERNAKFSETLNEQMNPAVNKSEQNTKTDISVPKIKEIAKDYAVKNGLPPALVDAVIKVESDFNPFAVSKKGATGLMQLMPGAIKDIGLSNPFNVNENIQAGVNILRKLMDKYDWDYKKALAAYNAGEKAVDKSMGIPPIKETREYVKKVIDAYIQNIK